jgi:hypothetical protein
MDELTPYERFQLEHYGNVLPRQEENFPYLTEEDWNELPAFYFNEPILNENN